MRARTQLKPTDIRVFGRDIAMLRGIYHTSDSNTAIYIFGSTFQPRPTLIRTVPCGAMSIVATAGQAVPIHSTTGRRTLPRSLPQGAVLRLNL